MYEFARTYPGGGRLAHPCVVVALRQDPELEATEVDELLTRQFGLLGDCLDDPVPAVRRAAASVTCSLLNVWWELVPSATAAQFLKRIAGLAFDSTRSRPCPLV